MARRTPKTPRQINRQFSDPFSGTNLDDTEGNRTWLRSERSRRFFSELDMQLQKNEKLKEFNEAKLKKRRLDENASMKSVKTAANEMLNKLRNRT
jgi:hypothetical protein